jgi:hypothetical protein
VILLEFCVCFVSMCVCVFLGLINSTTFFDEFLFVCMFLKFNIFVFGFMFS